MDPETREKLQKIVQMYEYSNNPIERAMAQTMQKRLDADPSSVQETFEGSELEQKRAELIARVEKLIESAEAEELTEENMSRALDAQLKELLIHNSDFIKELGEKIQAWRENEHCRVLYLKLEKVDDVGSFSIAISGTIYGEQQEIEEEEKKARNKRLENDKSE